MVYRYRTKVICISTMFGIAEAN